MNIMQNYKPFIKMQNLIELFYTNKHDTIVLVWLRDSKFDRNQNSNCIMSINWIDNTQTQNKARKFDIAFFQIHIDAIDW